jgi:hypothetical protein
VTVDGSIGPGRSARARDWLHPGRRVEGSQRTSSGRRENWSGRPSGSFGARQWGATFGDGTTALPRRYWGLMSWVPNIASNLVAAGSRGTSVTGRAFRNVPVDHRVACRGVGPIPLDDPLEERAHHPQPLPMRSRARSSRPAGAVCGQPHLDVLDLVAAHGSDRVQASAEHPAGEDTQRVLGHVDAGRGLERGQPLQIPLHRRHDQRRDGVDLRPLRRGRAAGERAISDRRAGRLRAHGAATCWTANIASTARYRRRSARRRAGTSHDRTLAAPELVPGSGSRHRYRSPGIAIRQAPDSPRIITGPAQLLIAMIDSPTQYGHPCRRRSAILSNDTYHQYQVVGWMSAWTRRSPVSAAAA